MTAADVTSVVRMEAKQKRLNFFERYLSLWVAACMIAGVLLGKFLPPLTDSLRHLEFGRGSQINLPIAVLIWLMIIPMMTKVDFTSILRVGQKPKGLLITLFVNWMVKPFSMALIAWFFFRHVFSGWIAPAEANQYIAGAIILAAVPCTAMVFVWNYLTDGDPAYKRVQVSLNDLIMLFLFAPIVRFLVRGAALATVVGVLIEVPVMLSVCAFCNRTRHWFAPAARAVAQ
jgi:arsenite transporter